MKISAYYKDIKEDQAAISTKQGDTSLGIAAMKPDGSTENQVNETVEAEGRARHMQMRADVNEYVNISLYGVCKYTYRLYCRVRMHA